MESFKVITGQEQVEEVASPLAALVEFYTAFNERNFEMMQGNWLQTGEASMSNPLGGLKRGWQEIREVYQKIFGGEARVYVEFYDYSMHVTGNMFLAVGRERGSLSLNDEVIELAIRTSRVYTLTAEGWKQVHHHGSMDKPELLAHYQGVLMNKNR